MHLAEEIAQAALEHSNGEATEAAGKAQQAAKAGGAVILTEQGEHVAGCPALAALRKPDKHDWNVGGCILPRGRQRRSQQ